MAMIWSLCVFATCIAAAIASAAPATGPASSDCSAVMYEMMPCVDYITIGSTKSKASKGCCKVVGGAMRTNADCICVALKQSGGMGIQLNLTRALSLPQSCRITAPLPHCGIPLPPGMAPAPVLPSTKPPSPAPRRIGPTLVPTMAPMLAPTIALTPASVPGVSPSNNLVPSNAPTGTPLEPDSPVMAPTPTESNAPSLTISFSLIVPLLLTLLVSFRPL